MSLYIIEDNDGNVLDSYGYFNNSMINAMLYDESLEPESYVKEYGGHVVKLTEKQKVKLPHQVGEELEDWLKTDNVDDILEAIACVYEGHDTVRNWWDSTLGATYLIADMARYGWEAEKETLYNVKVPLVQAQGGLWFFINASGKLDATYIQDIAKKFSREEINIWSLQDCEKEEVTDDEQ